MRALWVLPWAWSLHTLEEWNQTDWYHRYWIHGEDVSAVGMRVWLVAMIALGFVWTAGFTRLASTSWAAGLVLAFFVMQGLANTLQHLYWTGLLGVYSPGTATAVALVLPVLGFVSVRAIRARAVSPWAIAAFSLVSIPVMAITVSMGNEMPAGGLPVYRLPELLGLVHG